MADAKNIIYLVVCSSYFVDEPIKVKDWHLDAYEFSFDAWEKVEDLRKKEQIRVDNLCSVDPDFRIRHSYSVNCIILFG